MTTQAVPRWDLSNVYPSLSSKEFEADAIKTSQLIAAMEALLKEKASSMNGKEEVHALTTLAVDLIEHFNELLLTAGTLRATTNQNLTRWR